MMRQAHRSKVQKTPQEQSKENVAYAVRFAKSSRRLLGASVLAWGHSGITPLMILSTQTVRGTALALCVAIGGSIATPAVALADTGSTAAAIAIGAIIGTLIYDSSRHQYYYVNDNRHVYVSNATAQ